MSESPTRVDRWERDFTTPRCILCVIVMRPKGIKKYIGVLQYHESARVVIGLVDCRLS